MALEQTLVEHVIRVAEVDALPEPCEGLFVFGRPTARRIGVEGHGRNIFAEPPLKRHQRGRGGAALVLSINRRGLK